MSDKLPAEIIIRILFLIGEESTLYLKPFTLLNQQWHALAAPILLSTISVTSLGNLVKLCEKISSPKNTLRSIEAFTKTLVIAGETWGDRIVDSHAGLEDISDLPPYNPSNGDLAKPNVEMPPE